MKFEIKSRFEDKVLFSIETETLKLAVELAVKACAYLNGAYLRGADLRSADLSGAYLNGADLSGAYLNGADLRGADLRGADLRSADLRSADLSGAYLNGADLRGAYLSGAYLSGAYLNGADLRSADLNGAKGLNKFLTSPLYMLADQPGKIRAYKLVKKNGEGPFNGGIRYEVGKSYKVVDADKNETKQCAVGINLATLDWCIREWRDTYRILIAEFKAKDIAAIPIGNDGKFRVSKCKIVGEKDLKEIGILEGK